MMKARFFPRNYSWPSIARTSERLSKTLTQLDEALKKANKENNPTIVCLILSTKLFATMLVDQANLAAAEKELSTALSEIKEDDIYALWAREYQYLVLLKLLQMSSAKRCEKSISDGVEKVTNDIKPDRTDSQKLSNAIGLV